MELTLEELGEEAKQQDGGGDGAMQECDHPSAQIPGELWNVNGNTKPVLP